VAAVVDGMGRHRMAKSGRQWALPVMLGFLLAGCGEFSRFQTATPSTPTVTPKASRAVVQSPAAEKEHERILTTYGGAYDDPKLEALIGKNVDQLGGGPRKTAPRTRSA